MPALGTSVCDWCRKFFCVFSRRYLQETLKISNGEESHRLTACSLILLGHTFLKNGNLKVLVFKCYYTPTAVIYLFALLLKF